MMILQQYYGYLKALMGIMHGSRAFGGPIQANINITNRCNLRCIHCYYYSPHVKLPNFLKVRQCKQVDTNPDPEELAARLRLLVDTRCLMTAIDSLLASGTRRFQLSGYGELFMHPDILPLLERVKQGKAYALTNTNGILIKRDVADALIAMGFDDLRVSVMAGSGGVYARTHFGASPALFEQLKENLKYLAERKTALGVSRPLIKLAVVIIKENAGDLLNVARLAADVKASQVIYRGFDDVGDAALTPLSPAPEQEMLVRQQLQEAQGFLDSHHIRHNVPNILGVFRQQFDTAALYRVIPCYYGWLTIGVDVQGNVYPCSRCNETMGNLFTEGLEATWYGERYRRFRAQALTLPRRGTAITDCDCTHCGYHNANLRVYRFLHPWARQRLKTLKLISNKAS